MMPKQTLEDLQSKIDNTSITDPDHSAYLDELQDHISRGIDSGDHHPTLIGELEKGLILFDKAHPDLAAAIRAAISILSKGGV
jgi:hypothetical protein